APTILNAANEIAVAAFLMGRIRYTAIAPLVGAMLERLPAQAVSRDGLESLLEADRQARSMAEQLLPTLVT
ncbi:MAG TPA: 1-deoxy-D-xylulose-5-phosphate reductoisomerase, partial [Chromatiaceae bacterium]|nr:1-deoxy-D-xylulose-5-phosphate reductoisomerase [Chromatiaceae bacterium]